MNFEMDGSAYFKKSLENPRQTQQFIEARGTKINPFSINQQSDFRDSYDADGDQEPVGEDLSPNQTLARGVQQNQQPIMHHHQQPIPFILQKKNSISSEDILKTQQQRKKVHLQNLSGSAEEEVVVSTSSSSEKQSQLPVRGDVLSEVPDLQQNLLAQQQSEEREYVEYLSYNDEDFVPQHQQPSSGHSQNMENDGDISQAELEEYQLQELEQNSFRRCFVRKEYCFFFVIMSSIAVYVYFLFEQSVSVYFDEKQTPFCRNVSKWTFSLAILLSLVPLYFIVMKFINKHRYRHTFPKDAFLSIYEECGSKFLVFTAVVIGSFLSVYLFSEKSSENNCKVLVNLFQFYLFIFWLCLYLIIRAVIETSPEVLVPDSELLINSI